MKKASWIVALVVGIVIGFAVDRMSGGGSTPKAPSRAPAAQAPTAPRPPAPPPAARAAKVPLRPDDPVRGPQAAKITVVEFSDFQCPFCTRVGPTLHELEKLFPGDLRVVWKHLPLPMHPAAVPAAQAAEAAREQGKFWEMHDKLFAGQADLSPARYEQWAKEIGLDLALVKSSVESPKGRARIDEDAKLAAQVGATGTPTLFFNCRKVVGAVPLETMRATVEEELKKADALLARGAKVDAGFYDRACDENVAAQPEAAPPSAVKIDVRSDDPVRGNPAAPVTIVEFSDFQCPFCSRVVPTMKQIEAAYGRDVRIVWKNQPLPMHPEAVPAALAAEAAREQGKFWEMHDKLFENQRSLSEPSYEAWAKEIGLDIEKFRAAVKRPQTRQRIADDQALAQRVGANGTPTFFVNGEQVVGAQPFESFKAVIDRQLQKARGK